jgi:hypothetical protein
VASRVGTCRAGSCRFSCRCGCLAGDTFRLFAGGGGVEGQSCYSGRSVKGVGLAIVLGVVVAVGEDVAASFAVAEAALVAMCHSSEAHPVEVAVPAEVVEATLPQRSLPSPRAAFAVGSGVEVRCTGVEGLVVEAALIAAVADLGGLEASHHDDEVGGGRRGNDVFVSSAARDLSLLLCCCRCVALLADSPLRRSRGRLEGP